MTSQSAQHDFPHAPMTWVAAQYAKLQLAVRAVDPPDVVSAECDWRLVESKRPTQSPSLRVPFALGLTLRFPSPSFLRQQPKVVAALCWTMQHILHPGLASPSQSRTQRPPAVGSPFPSSQASNMSNDSQFHCSRRIARLTTVSGTIALQGSMGHNMSGRASSITPSECLLTQLQQMTCPQQTCLLKCQAVSGRLSVQIEHVSRLEA
eukprot:CAMPEP_0206500884 /NCGR_PEP_ID=MMETSP0324_2-20121206/52915_1 /ASSEMBLY_ACC=CAM_ASM_000836 /TAXON_ID=2866 /ORGANISM="Crypthecodinium cohnii, Strain Seligo" /LENGTH=206 /DNA_ID=CAMNT_0053988467 /DNA_START=721 /DNA_END=1342 /DNA_ORIENTATION=+